MNKRCFQLATALLAGLSLSTDPVLADSQTKQTQTASQQTTQVTQPSQVEQTAQPNQTDQAAKTSSQIKKATRKKKVVKVNLKDYLNKKPVVIRTKKAVTLYKNSSLSKKVQNVGKGAHYLVSSLSKNKNGVPVLRQNHLARCDLLRPQYGNRKLATTHHGSTNFQLPTQRNRWD